MALQGAVSQPVVDLVKLLLRSASSRPKACTTFWLREHFVDEGGLLAAGLGLQLEHGVGAPGDELGHEQGKRREQHHHQRDAAH